MREETRVEGRRESKRIENYKESHKERRVVVSNVLFR